MTVLDCMRDNLPLWPCVWNLQFENSRSDDVKTLFRGCLVRCVDTFRELGLLYWTNQIVDFASSRSSISALMSSCILN